MLNTQDYIITELIKNLGSMIFLTAPRLRNLIAIILGIIDSGSVVLSKIAQELKSDFSEGSEPSKVKRIYRFLKNDKINPELVQYHFARTLLKKYKNHSGKVHIIFDHTTKEDVFTILQFSLRVDNRTIPLWHKIFEYEDKNSKDFEHVYEGLKVVYELLSPYNFEVIVLADRGFRSVELFKFIHEELKWKYAIRCIATTNVTIPNKPKIKKLSAIKIKPNKKICFEKVLLTSEKYECNLGVSLAEDGDVWYIATNMSPKQGIREYKKRFDIEESFRDLKSNGFNMEDSWAEGITYFKNLHLCLSIAYSWLIILGRICSKNKKNKELGAIRVNKNGKAIRIYSLFRIGLKWFKRC
jgi:mRNA-degrading endonuclease RelE of RelBE toxin-antitoxin system